MGWYLWVKWVHILSATVLVGTGIGTAFHLYATHRRGDVRAIAVAARNTVLADWIFTATSIVLQPATGLILIAMAGIDWLQGWLVASYVLYLVAAACWIRVVAIQCRIRALAKRAADEENPLPAEYFAAMRQWFVLGWPALLSLVLVYALMVMRPAL